MPAEPLISKPPKQQLAAAPDVTSPAESPPVRRKIVLMIIIPDTARAPGTHIRSIAGELVVDTPLIH